jgi:uncharacterized protein YceH (UPF0502 family)
MNEEKVSRIASTILAFEHRDEGELRRYLQKHPEADKSKHWVKPKVEHDKEVSKKDTGKTQMSDNMAKELEKRMNQLKEKITTYETRAKQLTKSGKEEEAEKASETARSFSEKLEKLEARMKPYKEWLTRNKERK